MSWSAESRKQRNARTRDWTEGAHLARPQAARTERLSLGLSCRACSRTWLIARDDNPLRPRDHPPCLSAAKMQPGADHRAPRIDERAWPAERCGGEDVGNQRFLRRVVERVEAVNRESARVGRATLASRDSGLPTNAALAVELTLSRHDDATTRRCRKSTTHTRVTKRPLRVISKGSCPLAAPRFARCRSERRVDHKPPGSVTGGL